MKAEAMKTEARAENEPTPVNQDSMLPFGLRLGSDLVYIPRLQQAKKRHGDAFFRKLLTPAEWAYCQSGGEKRWLARAAVRLAVKEAVAKALGCGLNGLGWGQGIGWRDVEVISAHQQAPKVQLHGKAQEQALILGLTGWQVSISHDGDYGLATVIGLPSARSK